MSATLDYEELPRQPLIKPTALKILNVIIIARIVLMIVMAVLVVMASKVDPSDSSFWAEFLRGARNTIRITQGYSVFQVGHILGQLTIPFLLAIVLLALLKERNYMGAVITMSVILFASIAGVGNFFLEMVCMILLLSKKTKAYLKQDRV